MVIIDHTYLLLIVEYKWCCFHFNFPSQLFIDKKTQQAMRVTKASKSVVYCVISYILIVDALETVTSVLSKT